MSDSGTGPDDVFDVDRIRRLVELMEQHDLREVDLRQAEQRIRLYRGAEMALTGWDHYEISNFALPDRQCRHNLVYWHNEEYAGFGTGAYSFLNGVRARNCVSTATYMDNPCRKEESLRLTDAEIRLETVIQHLRLKSGLERAYYANRFGRTLDGDFGMALVRLADRGLVEDNGLTVRPTAQGFYLNNEIGLELVG